MLKIKILKTQQFWALIAASGLLITLFFNAGDGPIVLLKAENPRYEGIEIKDQTFSLRLRQENVRTLEVFTGVGEANKCQTVSYTFPVPVPSATNPGRGSDRPPITIPGSAVTQTPVNISGRAPVVVSASEVPSLVITVPFQGNHTLWMRTKDANNNYSSCEQVFTMSPFLYRAQDQGSASGLGLTLATADNAISNTLNLTLSEGFKSYFPQRAVLVRPRYYGRNLGDEAKITFFLGESCNQKLGESFYPQAMMDGVVLTIPNSEDDKTFTLSARLQYKAPGVYPQIHQSRCYIFARNLDSRVIPPNGEITVDNLKSVSLKFPDPDKIGKIELRDSCTDTTNKLTLSLSDFPTDNGKRLAILDKWQTQTPGAFHYRLIGLNGRYGKCGKLVDYSRGTSSEERARNRVEIIPQFDKSKFTGLKVKSKFTGLKVKFPAAINGQLQTDPMHIWVKAKENDKFLYLPVIVPIEEGHEWVHTNAIAGTQYEYKFSRGGRDIHFLSSGGYLVPWQENKGKLLIVVEDLLYKFNQNNLKRDLSTYINTLTSEGWQVEVITGKRHLDTDYTQSVLDVWGKLTTNDAYLNNLYEIQRKNNLAVAELKNQILQIYNKNPGQLKAVLLVGHLPIPYSGTHNIDGHPDHKGAWPADSYYGSLSGQWDDGDSRLAFDSTVRFENQNYRGDGKFNDDVVPGNTAFQIGRIDFSVLDIGLENKNQATKKCEDPEILSGYANVSFCKFAWESWISYPANTLLNNQLYTAPGFSNSFNKYIDQYRRYFKKNIAYRSGEFNPGNRLLQSTCDEWGAGLLGTGYTQSIDLFRQENITKITPSMYTHQVPLELAQSPALFVNSRGYSDYHQNGGAINKDQALASAPQSMRAVFWGMFGSYFGDTYSSNNILRSVLSSPTPDPVKDGNWGLASYYTHFPIMHRMALGGTIGESVKLALDVDSSNMLGRFQARVSNTLQGDPTLRMHVVPTPVSASWSKNTLNKTAEIRWKARANSSVSYYEIYWASSPRGSKIQIGRFNPDKFVYNSNQSFSWVDDKYRNQSSNSFYWVRPVYIQESLAGSYINKGLYTQASQGRYAEK
jgi:hypothetical protein